MRTGTTIAASIGIAYCLIKICQGICRHPVISACIFLVMVVLSILAHTPERDPNLVDYLQDPTTNQTYAFCHPYNHSFRACYTSREFVPHQLVSVDIDLRKVVVDKRNPSVVVSPVPAAAPQAAKSTVPTVITSSMSNVNFSSAALHTAPVTPAPTASSGFWIGFWHSLWNAERAWAFTWKFGIALVLSGAIKLFLNHRKSTVA